MKKYIAAAIMLLYATVAGAQELFVFTEPASNMAAKSIGFRLNNTLMKQPGNQYFYIAEPEVMIGVSKKIMVHAAAFFSNRSNSFTANGASAYLKYRFYSIDDVHSHFRVAAFAKYAYNNSIIQQPAIDLNGMNAGYEAGLVATKLVNKLALSASSSFVHAMDNGSNKFFLPYTNRNAVNYTLSAGKLLLPKEYTSYSQPNLNAMLEVLGQTSTANGNTFIDIAPSLQLILQSRLRIDLGYRYAVIKSLNRMAEQGVLVRLEYNIFNAF